jgi:hypothetical protein
VSVSAVDCVAPALQHTRQQLFSPFRLGQWSRLALVAVLAGELHVGSCNFGNWGQFASPRRHIGDDFLAPAFPHIDPARIAQFAGLIAAVVCLAIVLFFVFLYINSVFRFILFDSVLRKQCSIGDGWQRLHRPGRRYFLWQLVLVFSSAVFFALLIGIPAAMMGIGSMKNPSSHLAGIAGGVILLVLVGLACVLLLVAIQALARDFLVPIMALEDLDFADAWSRLLSLIRVEPWRYVGYLFLKLVMAIAAWIVFSILALIPVLFILGPTALLIFAGVAAGLTWNVTTVSLAIIFGGVALFVLLYVIALVATPATVFFPAYAMYFFAARYPNLQALVYPAPVAPPAPEAPPVLETPPQPPPLPPTPEPIG